MKEFLTVDHDEGIIGIDGDIYINDPELEMFCDVITENLLANNSNFKMSSRTNYATGITYTDEYYYKTANWTSSTTDGIVTLRQKATGKTEIYYDYICTPFVPISKVTNGYEFSVWFKVASVSAWDQKYPLQLNYIDASGSRLAYRSIAYNASLTNKPALKNNTWVKLICTIPKSKVSTIVTNYATGKSFSDVAFVAYRLELAQNGDISFKLPVLKSL